MRNTSHIFHRIGTDFGFVFGFICSIIIIQKYFEFSLLFTLAIAFVIGGILSHALYKMINIIGPQRPKKETILGENIQEINEKIFDGDTFSFICPVCFCKTRLVSVLKPNIMNRISYNCFSCHTPLYIETQNNKVKIFGYQYVTSLDVFFSNIWNYGKVGYKFWLFLSLSQIITSEIQIGLTKYLFTYSFLYLLFVSALVGNVISWMIYISFIIIGIKNRNSISILSLIIPIVISISGGVFQSYFFHYSTQTLVLGIVAGFIFPYYTINWAKRRRIIRDGFL